MHNEITEKEKEILESNLSDEEYKLFEKLAEDFKISDKKKLKQLAQKLYEKNKIYFRCLSFRMERTRKYKK